MTLISLNTKSNILTKLNDIVNIEEPEWCDLEIDLKFKIVHNLCNFLKNEMIHYSFKPILQIEQTEQIKQIDQINQTKLLNGVNQQFLLEKEICINKKIPHIDKILNNSLSIPLKNQRPKKIIEFCGINKQFNIEIFDEFRKNMININREFRKVYNSKNKIYSIANLGNLKYKSILNNYNLHMFNFMNKYIEKIDSIKLYNNLISGNNQKTININKHKLKINKISYIDEFLNIEFNNDISIKFELYFTSEKITSNIPAKYKISLINIF